jgi:chorismate mutase/prephenate dehydratase
MTDDSASLDSLRRQIDAIDDHLHDLVMERTALVGRIAAAKAQTEGIALRPGREAQVLRRLIGRHSGAFPKAALIRIWREIMGALVGLQRPFSVAVAQPARGAGFIELARDHFGVVWPLTVHPTSGQVVRDVANGRVAVGVVAAPRAAGLEDWWLALVPDVAHMPRVVARLPMLCPEPPPGHPEPLHAFVLAQREPEETGDDRTLVVVETVPDVSRDRLRSLQSGVGLECTSVLASHHEDGVWLHLSEVKGFVAQNDARLIALTLGYPDTIRKTRILGGYAVPISV